MSSKFRIRCGVLTALVVGLVGGAFACEAYQRVQRKIAKLEDECRPKIADARRKNDYGELVSIINNSSYADCKLIKECRDHFPMYVKDAAEELRKQATEKKEWEEYATKITAWLDTSGFTTLASDQAQFVRDCRDGIRDDWDRSLYERVKSDPSNDTIKNYLTRDRKMKVYVEEYKKVKQEHEQKKANAN